MRTVVRFPCDIRAVPIENQQSLACRSSLALFALSRWAISDPSIAVHAATCPGVTEARKASIVSPDMKSALAAPIALKLQ